MKYPEGYLKLFLYFNARITQHLIRKESEYFYFVSDINALDEYIYLNKLKKKKRCNHT